MKRRTALKQIAAGAGSTFALVSTVTAASNPDPEDLEDAEFRYRVTENGVEEVEPGDYCAENPECCVYCASDCPYDCYDGCQVVDPFC